MKNYILLFFYLFLSFGLFAQHKISGNFTPATNFKWLIAYELTPDTQKYTADTAVKEGYFSFEFPANATKGVYRLVYAIPQEEFYIDILYNGQEDIEFNFNLDNGVSFIKSEENIAYSAYLSEITPVEQKLLDFYESGNTSKKEYKVIRNTLLEIQSKYEALEEQTIAHQLIKANTLYIPESYETLDVYSTNKSKAYFDHLDFSNTLLLSSGFLKDKLSNYVFSALPLDVKNKEEMETAILKNVAEIEKNVKDTQDSFKIIVYHNLWKIANSNELNTVADAVFSTYLKDLAIQNGQQTLVDDIELSSRLRLGELAPEITWTKNDKTVTLSNLQGSEYYVLVFWSSTCSHCLKELPALHKELINYNNVSVVAVGLEDNQINWDLEINKLPNFKHALALGKWESDYAHLFGIKRTPTYFILDKEKRFVAQPEDDMEVISFLNTN